MLFSSHFARSVEVPAQVPIEPNTDDRSETLVVCFGCCSPSSPRNVIVRFHPIEKERIHKDLDC
jgi:hypothetical protein